MGAYDCIQRSDIKKGESQTITIDSDYFIDILLGRGSFPKEKSFNNLSRHLLALTKITGKEMAAEYYTPFRKNPGKIKGPPNSHISAIVGSEKSVPSPRLSGLESDSLFNESGNHTLFVPLINIHTHPGWDYSPSLADIEQACEHRINRTYSLKDEKFRLSGQLAHVILAKDYKFFFWRYNEESQAYNSFKKLSRDEKKESSKDFVFQSGAFTIHEYCFAGHEKIHKEKAQELADKFCPYDITIEKV